MIESNAADDAKTDSLPRVAVVGPCSAGKSTLLPSLKEAGYRARSPAQEHSIVPDMWRRLYEPQVLIYLDVTYEQARARRPHIDGGPQRLADQHRKLAHARQHSDYYLDTSGLTPQEVSRRVLRFLEDFEPES